MEATTPIFSWAKKHFLECEVIGSEYLGHGHTSGEIADGILHEDIAQTSFSDGEFDIIVSNDVFEHVPFPQKSFLECAKILNRTGVMLATIPFYFDSQSSHIRASMDQGILTLHDEAVYHGNSISGSGSLVFYDFGWDLLDMLRQAGFLNPVIKAYYDGLFGHLGNGLMIFSCAKEAENSGS